MAISSVGLGSSILTQDVLDQLRKADEGQIITPIDLELANENDKDSSLQVIDASMTNLIDSINAISPLMFNDRKATVTGTSVSVTAASNSDLQSFTLNVTQLATKQIEESGAFTAGTDLIAAGATGTETMTINVGSGTPLTLSYDNTTTLDDLKNQINADANSLVDATVLQISPTEARLVLSAKDTGSTQDISIVDNSAGGVLDTKLTTGLTAIQTGLDSQFTYNGQAITRSSNTVTDLVSGYTITLNEVGSSDVVVEQDRTSIMDKIDSFIEKYNSTITELNKQTLSSTDSSTRGIFSNESTVKSMKRTLQDMMDSITGGVASMEDFGFSIDRDGKMSVDKTVLNSAMDTNMANVQAFFTGGNYTKADSTVVSLTGVFDQFSTTVSAYTKTNGILDQLKDSIGANITALTDRKTNATERLDSKYEILKKQFIAYDAMIAKFNSTSSLLTQMAAAQTSSSGN